MKIVFLIIIAALISISFNCSDSSAKIASVNNAANGFAVIELFTSEGCSSCPPADAAVAKILKEHSSNVYVLGYHVDYWDNLGWKDMFSNAAYTQLQRNYAKNFKLSSVYTPQVVVNGTEQFVGSDESRLNAAVEKDLQQTSDVKLSVDAEAGDDYELMLHYKTNATNGNIRFALIQLSATNKIQRGENNGATLHHVNIVRAVQTVPTNAKGTAQITVPENVDTDQCHVIAFVQDVNNKIVAATEIPIHLFNPDQH